MDTILDRLKFMFIGSDELSGKITGLARRKVYSIINCSTQKVVSARGIPVIQLQCSDQTFEQSLIDLKLLSRLEIQEIDKFFQQSSHHKRIMIHSEHGTKTRLVYCLIGMQVLGLRLNQLVEMWETMHRAVCQETHQGIDELDSENFTPLNHLEIQILQKAEEKIFGSISYHLPNPDIHCSDRSDDSSVLSNDSDDISVNDDLVMKLYVEDLQQMENDKLIDVIATESVAEPMIDSGSTDKIDEIRAPDSAKTMCLFDSFLPSPDQQIEEDRELTKLLSIQNIDASLTQPPIQPWTHPPIQFTSPAYPSNTSERLGRQILAHRPETQTLFADFMSMINRGRNRSDQVSVTNSLFKNASDEKQNNKKHKLTQSFESTSFTNPFDLKNQKEIDYKNIMNVVAGRVDPDLVMDMLNSGMGPNDIIDSLI